MEARDFIITLAICGFITVFYRLVRIAVRRRKALRNTKPLEGATPVDQPEIYEPYKR